jgi:hypothetical protein
MLWNKPLKKLNMKNLKRKGQIEMSGRNLPTPLTEQNRWWIIPWRAITTPCRKGDLEWPTGDYPCER